MDINLQKRNELLAKTVIKALKSRKINGYYAANDEEAVAKALELIGEGSSVTMGGCMTAREIGLFDALKSGNYNFIDRDEAEDRRAAMLQAYSADAFITSANAMSSDGVIVNIDGFANRISAIAYGPAKVIFIVGMNKICPDVDSAIKRARNTAAPANAQRLNIDTPCRITGTCLNCKSPDSICSQIMITRLSADPDRMHVIIVNEEHGF